MGIATSRKLGTKPRRNYQKRRIVEILRSLNLTDARDRLTQDLVVVVGVKAENANFATLHGDLTKLVEEANATWAKESASS